MKKIVLWYTMFWYVISTWVLYELCQKAWNILLYDLFTGFSESKEFYGYYLIGTAIISLLGIILTWILVKKVRVLITIRINKPKRQIKLNPVEIMKKITPVFWIFILVAIVYSFVHFPLIHKNKIWENYVTIAHAGGVIDEIEYSNCEEAILSNYEKGHKIFEIDLCLTSDDKIVGKHDWEEHIIQEGFYKGYIPTEEKFLSTPLYGKYTPLSFVRLCEIMDEYPDMWIVTDSKETGTEENIKFFTIMVETAESLGLEKVLDRIIVQLYNQNMQDTIRKIYPFKSWIFTLYQTEFKRDEGEFLEYVRYCYANNISAITMQEARVTPNLVEIGERYNVKIYVYTVNDLDKAYHLFQNGISGIYTDRIVPNQLNQEVK